MRVAIAGAGNVGRSIAAELLGNGHEVLLIEREPRALKVETVPGAEWLLADACELDTLVEARAQSCDVVVAATGDDKVNLVVSLLAKTEFGVDRVVARETFGVENVVARIYDPRRAEVYQKLGIPTVATVRWTADQVLRRLVPAGMLSEWRDPSGNVVLAELAYNEGWIGHKVTRLEEQSGARVSLLTRLGEGILPHRGTVIQDGDLVHVTMRWDEREQVERAFATGPTEGD